MLIRGDVTDVRLEEEAFVHRFFAEAYSLAASLFGLEILFQEVTLRARYRDQLRARILSHFLEGRGESWTLILNGTLESLLVNPNFFQKLETLSFFLPQFIIKLLNLLP